MQINFGGKFALLPYVSAFKIISKIVDLIELMFLVKKDYINVWEKIQIEELGKALFTETIKIHIIAASYSIIPNHLQCLGLWFEQASKSAHREFLNCWKIH